MTLIIPSKFFLSTNYDEGLAVMTYCICMLSMKTGHFNGGLIEKRKQKKSQ